MKKLILFFITTFLFLLPQKAEAQVPVQDSLALVAFYNSTNGANWTNNTNWLNGQVSTWAGINVNLGRVYTINLSNNNITGTIPTDIGNLTGLRNIILNDNQITGEIPSQIGLLTELSVLMLMNNQMSGNIPVEIANLNMSNLSLSFNNFTGSIPNTVGTWEVLYNLRLNDNHFTNLPSLISLPAGSVVNVENNRFEFDDLEPNKDILSSYSPQDSIGIAQDKTVNFGESIVLDITTGGTENSYKWFKNGIEILGQTGSRFTVTNATLSDAGNYSVEVNNSIINGLTLYTRPTKLSIDNTNYVADSLALVALYNTTNGSNWVDKSNWLNGDVSNWFGVTVSNGRVTELNFRFNQLSGNIPPEIGQLTNLIKLDLGVNQLSGSIPTELAQLTNLTLLDLGNNNLTGGLPPELEQLSKLTHFYLGNNQLTGAIPPELGNLNSLNYFFLHDNQFTGSIPPELGNLNIIALGLNGNQFTGSIPVELGLITFLNFLDLSSNLLTGSVPAAITQLMYLNEFNLSDNKFTSLPDFSAKAYNKLAVENNMFEFDDLEPNMGISNFSYSPQDSIGFSRTIEVALGEELNFSITTAGNQNTYKWFKSGSELTGQTNATLLIENAKLSDAGDYYAEVNNTIVTGLTLVGRSTKVNVNKTAFIADSLIMVTLYNSTGGPEWTNSSNWLNGDVSTWHGVTVTNGRITALDLNTNNLVGSIPSELNNLTALNSLKLNGNRIINLPNLSTLPLTLLSIENNRLEFDDIEPNIGIANFSYVTQDSIGLAENKSLGYGEELVLNITVGGSQNTYLWFKDGLELTDKTGETLIVPNVTIADTGIYYSEIKNTIVTDLTLSGRTTRVYIESNILSDSVALVEFYNATNGANWKDKTNWLIGPVSSWYGVTVTSGRVTDLKLADNMLEGTIPITFGNLNMLKMLDLSRNNLSDSTQNLSKPGSAADFKKRSWTTGLISLSVLILTNNLFSGVLTEEIGELSELEELDLSDNNFSGELPAEMGNLKKLKKLNVGNNKFSGELRAELGYLDKLETFDVSNNQFTGELPLEISYLTELKNFNAGYNNFSGEIKAEYGNFEKMESWDVSNNNFSGNLAFGFTSNYMQSFDISYNKFTGGLPSEIGNNEQLKNFNASNNQFTGGIQKEFGKYNKLETFNVGANYLSGSLPRELGNMKELLRFDIGYNQFNGEIPELEEPWYKLKHIDISNNQLQDSGNNLFTNWISAGINFEGFSQSDSLKRINVSDNKFSVGLSLVFKTVSGSSTLAGIGDFVNLEVLDIANNFYTGELSAEIGKLTKLKKLDVGRNKLTGNLPEEIGNLVSLDTLNLGKNRFTGQLPLSMINLTNLAFFNMDSTQLEIPNDSSFQNWFSNISEVVTKVDELKSKSGTIPNEFALEQNYPNPFNPTTTIQYAIPNVASGLPAGQASFSLSNVQLKIYDLLGREVRTLVNEVKSPGTYEVKFDASQFTSGVYFYKLQSGDFTEIKKMLLMK